MLVAFSLPVVLQNYFSGVKFRAKFEVVLQKQFLSVVAISRNQTFLMMMMMIIIIIMIIITIIITLFKCRCI